MTVKQISVFMENRPGCLAELTEVLSQNKIDMRAMSIAETSDFGILRIIVNDSYNAARVMKDAGYVVSVTDVLAVAIQDKPGSLLQCLTVLGQAGINLEYSYAFTTPRKDVAYMVFRVPSNEKAIEVLSQNGIRLLTQEELDNL